MGHAGMSPRATKSTCLPSGSRYLWGVPLLPHLAPLNSEVPGESASETQFPYTQNEERRPRWADTCALASMAGRALSPLLLRARGQLLPARPRTSCCLMLTSRYVQRAGALCPGPHSWCACALSQMPQHPTHS